MSWRDGRETAKWVFGGVEDEDMGVLGVGGEGRKKKGHFARVRFDGLRYNLMSLVR